MHGEIEHDENDMADVVEIDDGDVIEVRPLLAQPRLRVLSIAAVAR